MVWLILEAFIPLGAPACAGKGLPVISGVNGGTRKSRAVDTVKNLFNSYVTGKHLILRYGTSRDIIILFAVSSFCLTGYRRKDRLSRSSGGRGYYGNKF